MEPHYAQDRCCRVSSEIRRSPNRCRAPKRCPFEEKAFYDILKSIAKQFNFEYPEEKLLALASEIKKIVDDKSRYTDWANRDDIKAELKMDLILVLAEHGYPPVTNDEVFKEIFEQAENFKKYNG